MSNLLTVQIRFLFLATLQTRETLGTSDRKNQDKMIETNRLIIRPYVTSDVLSAFSLFNDKDVMQFIPNGIDISIQATKDRINKYIIHFNKYGFGKCVLIDKSTNELVGDCGICRIENTVINELGYRIKKKYWNQGLATEAAIAFIDYAFVTLKFNEIHAIVEKENKKSIYMLENKLGFKHIGQIHCYGDNFELYRL